MAFGLDMAIMTIKSTYALDVPTVKALEEMARVWKVSKSEALRRAIRSAAERETGRAGGSREALDDLQRALALSPAKARTWSARVRRERRAASARSEARGR
jgi:Ribbon-helix-helix protein, copG family